MKKLLLTLVALITAMTMSAQLSFVKSHVTLPSNTQDFTLRSSQNILGLYSHDFINPEIQFGFSVDEGTQCAVAVSLWPEKLADFQGGKITAFKLGFTQPVRVNGIFVATCKVDTQGDFYDIDNWTEWDCDMMAELGWNIIDVPTPFTINTDEDTHLLIGYYMIQPSLVDDGNYCMGVSDMVSEEEMHDYSLWLYTGDYWHQQYFSQEYNYYMSVQCIVEMDDDIDPTEQCQAPTGDYTITDLEQATITLTNNEPDATVVYQVYCNGVFISEGEFTGDNYSFVLEGVGTYQVTAIAKKDGYKDSTPGGFFFTIQEGEAPDPVDPTEKTGAPTFNGYTEDGIHAYFVEIIPTEPSTIYYRVQFPDGTWSEWAEYEEMLSFTGDGRYRVEAYAVAVDKLPSEEIAYEFVVSPYTGLSEMNAGKTVAGVRYFNMAGQEMPEANGLTIMITTYTDGTSIATKVVK